MKLLAIVIILVIPLVLIVVFLVARLKSTSNEPDATKADEESKLEEDKLKWYEIGEDNPFNKKILDIRELTWSWLSTTSDESIARRYIELRGSNGRYLIDASLRNASSVDCNLSYPHNGEIFSGIIFKADSMEVKWDIYVYNNVFYFAKSCTGDLVYKAHAVFSDTEIRINRIEFVADEILKDEPDLAKHNVHFLIMSHALNRMYPHQIPASIPDDPKTIALYSFALFGKRACYATRDGILDIEVNKTSVGEQ
jgi:hypothetical protein